MLHELLATFVSYFLDGSLIQPTLLTVKPHAAVIRDNPDGQTVPPPAGIADPAALSQLLHVYAGWLLQAVGAPIVA
jgi:hypothetical protein